MHQHVNWLAVLVAALSTFLLGGLWYSPVLFGRAWIAASGVDEDAVKAGPPPHVFAFSFLFSLLMAANLAMFLADPTTTVLWGATAGFLAGFGWVALALAVINVFERRSWKYICINGGYMTLAFIVMGVIIGAWR
jgi:hypothetical protein